jgi:hypothetical protein
LRIMNSGPHCACVRPCGSRRLSVSWVSATEPGASGSRRCRSRS